MNIPVFKPYIHDNEINAATESLKLGWLGPGSYVKKFEEAISEFLELKDKHVVAVNTGTSAVHLALKICGVSSGDEVITPSFNNIADFQSIHALNAHPVFCDILEDSLTIDPKAIESLITEKTKAIICIDFGASLCDYEGVKAVAAKYYLPVIHDAAHAFGSAMNGKKVGNYSDICVFSFDPVKNITCIDGGAIIVNSKNLAEQMQHMRQLGQKQSLDKLYQNQRSWTYDVENIGFRYHLANLHAAIGLQQINNIDKIFKGRRQVFNFYTKELQDVSGIILPQITNDQVLPFIYVIRVLNGKRDAFRNALQEQGVDTGIHWQPGHLFSLFKNAKRGDLSITDKIAKEIVTIPLYPDLSKEEAAKVVYAIKDFFIRN